MDVSLIAAFAAGVISFLSPCVLPLVPAYISLITSGGGVSPDGKVGAVSSWRVARDTGLFVLGFGSVFVALGAAATSVGQVLFANQVLLTRLSGAALLLMAMFLAGSLVLRAPWLYGERRMALDTTRFGPFAAPVAGVAFGFGWTPCIGPVLTSILAIAATRQQASEGALLLAVYTAGLGLPFLAAGLALSRLAGVFGWIKHRSRGITMASAGFLGAFGVLLIFNQLVWVTGQLRQAMEAVGLGWLVTLG